jgi:hypothetical protein
MQKFGVKQVWQLAIFIGVHEDVVRAKLTIFNEHFPYFKMKPFAHSMHYPLSVDFKHILFSIYCFIDSWESMEQLPRDVSANPFSHCAQMFSLKHR